MSKLKAESEVLMLMIFSTFHLCGGYKISDTQSRENVRCSTEIARRLSR